MLTVTDASGAVHEISRGTRVGPAGQDVGSQLAVDTLRRTASVLGVRVVVVDLEGISVLNVHPGTGPGPADVLLDRPYQPAVPPYGDPLALRLAWLASVSLDVAAAELAQWRLWVAGWAESPSKPICSEVQRELLAALADDLATSRAVEALRGSLDLGLPPGCLFETWAWADNLLGLDLASAVGR